MSKVVFLAILYSLVVAADCFAQTPTPVEIPQERILIEEVKVNISAFDTMGNFITDVKKEDLIIVEDDRLTQATAVRRTPANILIALDTGGIMSGNISVTRAAARKLIDSFAATDNVAIFQFGDKVEMLSDWTTDKETLRGAVDKKMTFSKRSFVNKAIDETVTFLRAKNLDNRHLILITSGLDSSNDQETRRSALARLTMTDINTHVISFTYLQKGSIASQKAIFNEGVYQPRRLPEEVVDTLPDPKGAGKKEKPTVRDIARMPRLGGVSLDLERLRRARKDTNELNAAEKFLSSLAADTNGQFLLPKNLDEMIDVTDALATFIDSQYVVTFTPRRPLVESRPGEIRQITVSSRRSGVQVEGNRKLTIATQP